MVKNLPAMQETQETRVPSPGQEDPLEEEMAPAPVSLPRESQGQRSLAGYGPWGCRVVHSRATEHTHTICLSLGVYVHVYICVFVYMHMCMCVCIRVCLCISVCLCMCICVCVSHTVYFYKLLFVFSFLHPFGIESPKEQLST